MAQNVFDQFDSPQTSNVFDQFDDSTKTATSPSTPATPASQSLDSRPKLSQWNPTIGERLKIAADDLGQKQPFKTIGEIPGLVKREAGELKDFAKASFGMNPQRPLPPSPLTTNWKTGEPTALSPENVPSGEELTRDTGLPRPVTETVSAIDKTVAGLASFVTSPEGAEQMATFGVPVLKLPMAAKWISDMVKGGYLNIKDAVDAFKKGDTQRLRDNIIGATANFLGAIGVAGGEHARIKDYFNKLDKPEAVAPPASREAPAPMNERDAVSNIPAAAPVLTGASLYPLPKGAQPPKETPPPEIPLTPESAANGETSISEPITSPAKPQEAQHPKSTEDAYRIGLAIKTPEELANLKAQQESFGAAGRKAMAEKRINDASGLITTAGFYREAYEAATGTGSAAYHFRDDPNYKPPFPQPEVESKNAPVVAPQEASGVAPAAATPPEQSLPPAEAAKAKESAAMMKAESDELSALRKKDLSEDGLTKDEEQRLYELTRKESRSNRSAKTLKMAGQLKEQGVEIPDSFLHPSDGVENHITSWTYDHRNGMMQIRVERHTDASMSGRLITAKAGDTLTDGMDDAKVGTTRYREANPDSALRAGEKPTPPAPAEKPAAAVQKVADHIQEVASGDKKAKQPASPNLEPPKPGEIVGMGGDVPHPRQAETVGAGQDIYGVAARVRKARADAGQVAPVPTGVGVSPEEAVKWGQDLIAMGADPEVSMREFERTRATSFDLIAFTRAYGEQLAKAARSIEEKFGTDSKEYRMAQKALSDWDARSKAIQTEWHKQGMAQQGETDIDTGSFTGIARAVREVTGEDLNSAQAKTAKQIAKGVADADKAVEPAKVNLQTAIDNLTETGAPRYSDTIIKIAEKIVSSLDKRADAARARIRARAFTFSANIDPTVLRDVAEIGASHIAHWGLDFAKWSKVMVDEFGDKINPHLKTIFDASQKLVDAEGDKHGPNAETVKKAVKKTGGTKAPTDLAEQQKVFQDYQSGKPMTPIQVKTLWQRAKDEYINGGDTNMGDTVHKLADDLGLDSKDVLRGLSQTKQVKRIADDVWQKQRQARLLKQAAKRWIEHSQETWLQKVLPATAKTMFSMKVGLHGTVALGTHAPLVVATHPIVFANNFGKMYKLVASPEYFEMQKSALARRPNYNIAQRNGLVNDMNKMEDFNDPQLAQGFPKMAAWFKEQLSKAHLGRLQGMGTRGYSVLKILRQDLFDHEWDKLSESQKSDSMAKAISDSVNHITGVTKAGAGQLGKAASYALFAPKLEASRVAVMVADPLKAANSLIKMGNMTEAEKWFVKNQFKEKAKVAAVGFGLLLANQQLNNLFGDKKKLNGVPASLGGGGWNPMASDFMKFRVAGMNFAWGSPFLTMARLPLRLYQIGAGSGGKTKYLIYPDESMYKTAGSYLRTQASPFLSPIISVITKGDYADRPLPQIPGYGEPPPVPKRLAAQGVKPYTWPEFLSDIVLPIPVEQAMNDIWHSHELSNTEQQDHALTKAFVTGIIMAGTGGRVSDDWNKGETAAPTTRPAANPFKIQKPRL